MSISQEISPDFRPARLDSEIVLKVIRHEATGKAIRKFNNLHHQLTDYDYWFLLSTLWVSYSGHSDLELWKRLFRSSRPRRETSIMKPYELAHLQQLPETVTAYRAHRAGETDWIAYTLTLENASGFAVQRGVSEISEYHIPREHIYACFLRRKENEIIVLDRECAVFVRSIRVIEKSQD